METMKQSGLWSSLGTHGSLVVIWWLCISSSGEARKFDFKVKFDLEGRGQLLPKTIGILTNVFCTSGPNLVILGWMGDELWCGQAQNGVNFDFDLKFDLEVQSWLPSQNNRDLNQGVLHLWSKFGDPSLNGWWVIARTNFVTDGRTDRGNDNTRKPKLASGKKTAWLTHCGLVM